MATRSRILTMTTTMPKPYHIQSLLRRKVEPMSRRCCALPTTTATKNIPVVAKQWFTTTTGWQQRLVGLPVVTTPPPLTSSSSLLSSTWTSITRGSHLPGLMYTSTSRNCRWLSTTATSTTTTTTGNAGGSSSGGNRKGTPGILTRMGDLLLDHIGTIFVAGLALLIGSLVRSFYNSTNRNRLRDVLEQQAALDPLELHDLRSVNAAFTVSIFRTVMQSVMQEQQQLQQSNDVDGVTYADFVHTVRRHLHQHEVQMQQQQTDASSQSKTAPPCYTVEFGHFLDRVVLQTLQNRQKQNQPASEMPQPWRFWWTVLSLAVSATPAERTMLLYEILQATEQQQQQKSNSSSNHNLLTSDQEQEEQSTRSNTKSTTNAVTIADVLEMVQFLQDTCQLVPDTQIVPRTEHLRDQYPLQQYERGTPEQLLASFLPSPEERGPGDAHHHDDIVDLNAFAEILRSKSVCAWGMCYSRKKLI